MEKHLLSDPNVRELIRKFDLDEPQLYKIIVDDYCFINGNIVISSARQVTDEGSRQVDLSKLVNHLDKCNVIFGNVRKQGTDEAH